MKKLLTTTAVAFLGLALIGTAQAGKSGGGSSSGKSGGSSSSKSSSKDSHHEFKELHHDKDFHHEFKESHHDFKDFRNQRFFYYGRNNHFWSEYRCWNGHNCYVYWCPQNDCWYYWNDFYGCYTPVAVEPVPFFPCW